MRPQKPGENICLLSNLASHGKHSFNKPHPSPASQVGKPKACWENRQDNSMVLRLSQEPPWAF